MRVFPYSYGLKRHWIANNVLATLSETGDLPALAEDRLDLGPERRVIGVGIGL